MEFTSIVGTQLRPSRIGLGTWAIGGLEWGGHDDEAALATIRRAFDAGINVIDTAPIYGEGHAEEVVGKALKGWRDRVLLATKAGLEWHGNGEVSRNASAARIYKELDASLRRLQTDYVDVYLVHWPDDRTPMEETALAMAGLLKSGKIRAIGVSNFSPAQMQEFARYAPLHVVQPPYNIFETAAARDVLPYAQSHELCAFTYSALCRGLLSGTMTRETVFHGDDVRLTDPKFQQPRFDHYLGAIARLDAIARERFGKRVIHLALRWLLDSPGVGVALWGARKPHQLEPIDGAFDFHVDDDLRKTIVDIVTEEVSDPIGPDFLAPPLATRS